MPYVHFKHVLIFIEVFQDHIIIKHRINANKANNIILSAREIRALTTSYCIIDAHSDEHTSSNEKSGHRVY